MSYNTTYIPAGINSSECERSNTRTDVPLRFVPDREEKSDAIVDKLITSRHTVEISLGESSTERFTIFSGGSNEAYVQVAANIEGIYEKSGKKALYAGWKNEIDGAVDELQMLELTKPKSSEHEEGEVKEVEQKETSSAAEELIPRKQKSKDWLEYEQRKQVLLDKVKNARDAQATIMQQNLENWNLLLDRAQGKRFQAIVKKICYEKWTDSDGKVHEPRGLTPITLKMCEREWLRAVLPDDAAELQREYMQFGLHKSDRLSIKNFFGRWEEINFLIAFLPCLYDVGEADKPMNRPFTEQEMVSILLRCFPRKWVNVYRMLNHRTASTVQVLKRRLERVEVVIQDQRPRQNPKNKDRDKKQDTGKKRPADGDENRDPKKRRTQKHCERCQKYGGAAHTHNTNECRKYDKGGNQLPGFRSKKRESGQTRQSNAISNLDASNVASLAASVAAQAKELKGLKRLMHHSRKRHRDDRSDDDSASS